MSNPRLPIRNDSEQEKLQLQLESLRQELANVQQETRAFEGLLRAQLSDLILEAQELHSLYKQIKKAKKAKRLAQKKRGRNYKEPTGVVRIPKEKVNHVSLEDEKEKKRLYREAMLHVHPDKFSMNETEAEVATEVTSRLIEIYKTGSLETLQAYHAHIFRGNTNITLGDSASEVLDLLREKRAVPTAAGAKVQGSSHNESDYLQLEIEKVYAELTLAKDNQLYRVKSEYANPLTFVDELKEYYEERISRLKKRTRKGL